MDEARVSVIICCHTSDRWNEIQAAVESIRQQTIKPEKTIVVVDHNPALLADATKTLTDCIVVGNEGPKGLSGARNTGIAHASADIIAFLDDDAVAEPGWIEAFATTISGNVVAAGSRIDPVWPTVQPEFFPTEFNWIIGCTYPGMATVSNEIRNMIGASMAFRSDVLDEVGGFRTNVGRSATNLLGGEETELCIRVRSRMPEARIVLADGARAHHRVSPDRTTIRYFARRSYAEGVTKLRVVKMTSAATGLSSEARYVTKTLPVAVGRYLAMAARERELRPIKRVGAILLGIISAGLGYAGEAARSVVRGRQSATHQAAQT